MRAGEIVFLAVDGSRWGFRLIQGVFIGSEDENSNGTTLSCHHLGVLDQIECAEMIGKGQL